MKVECLEVENILGLYVEGGLAESQSAMVRAHLSTCEACALLALEMEFTISLCKEFPELEPPPRLIEKVLQETVGQHQSLSWREYLRELFRPCVCLAPLRHGGLSGGDVILNCHECPGGESWRSPLEPDYAPQRC